MKHVLSILEIDGSTVRPLEETFVKGSVANAKDAAKALIAQRGEFELRTISHSTDGKLLAYVVRRGPQKRRRFISESSLKPQRR